MFDVLKRYLLIVWNFFFGQASSESIQDSPKDQPEESVDVVPSVEEDEEILNGEEIDDIDILDAEEEDEDEDEEEEEEDNEEEDPDEKIDIPKKQENKVVINDIPKKQEDKVVINDVPTKPSGLVDKVEDIKVPDVPKTKDVIEVKEPEKPKVNEVEIKEKEKPKAKSDETEKKENIEEKKTETPKLKPEFEVIEQESPKVFPGKNAATTKLKSDFEIIEREAEPQLPDPSELKPEFEIVEREVSKIAPAIISTPELKPEVETKGKEVAPGKQDASATKPDVVGIGGGKEAAKGVPEKDAAKPPTLDVKSPEKSSKTNHVKFEVDEIKKDAEDSAGAGDVVKSHFKSSPLPDRKLAQNHEFVASEKGAAAANQTDHAGGPQKTEHPIDAFISGEQRHTGRQLQPESILDQQLDYSDSGEELSDDDIEIDYEDDEDDEEVEEVKPLPPVARSVYKKND